MTGEQKQKCKEYQKQYRENKTNEQKLKMKYYQKEYGKNITDQQKQKYKEARKDYNITDERIFSSNRKVFKKINKIL